MIGIDDLTSSSDWSGQIGNVDVVGIADERYGDGGVHGPVAWKLRGFLAVFIECKANPAATCHGFCRGCIRTADNK